MPNFRLEFAQQIERQLLRAGDDHLERASCSGLALRRKARRNVGVVMRSCSLVPLDRLDQLRGIERVRISDDARPAEQRPPERDGEAEAVEDRQRAEDRLEMDCAEDRADLRRVGEDVAMGQHHRLGLARAAAGEEQRGFLAVAVPRQSEPAAQQPERAQAARSIPQRFSIAGGKLLSSSAMSMRFSSQGKSLICSTTAGAVMSRWMPARAMADFVGRAAGA